MRTNLEVHCMAHPDPETWIFYFPWTTNPLPMNGSHGGWRTHSRKAKAIVQQALTLLQLAHVPALGRCTAHVTWWFTTKRTRDEDNLADLEKRLFDAIVRAGIVADDSPEYMTKPRARIRPVTESDGLLTGAGFTLTITRQETQP